MNWINIKDKLPEKGEYVLIKAEYCKYPYCVGLYNGINWISADDKTKILNVQNWCSLLVFESKKTKEELIEWVHCIYLQNLSGREDFKEAFEYGIKSAIDEMVELQLIDIKNNNK